MKKNLRVTRKKKNLRQLMLLGVCAITLATSIPATETAFAQYSYEFTVPQYTEKNIRIFIETSSYSTSFVHFPSGATFLNSDFNNTTKYPEPPIRDLDQTAVVINGRTFVPMRQVFEALGCKVDWDQSSRTAIVSKDGTTVNLTIGNTQMQVSKNGTNSQVALDAAPVVINGRTLLPLRAPAEAFGYVVTWDQQTISSGLKNNNGDYISCNGAIYIRDSEKQAAADASAKAEAERQAEQAAQKAAEEAARAERDKKYAAALAQLEQMDKQYKSGPALDEATYAQEVVKCINIFRSHLGLPAYTVDSGLASAAQIRAKECATKFSHVRPDGTDCFTAVSNYNRYGGSMEILARRIPGTDSPADFVIGWWNSEAGHGMAIISTEDDLVGIGFYRSTDQVYCAGLVSHPIRK